MYRFYFLLAILVIVSATSIARPGQASNESSSHSHEGDCKKSNGSHVGSKESSESDRVKNGTAAAMINGTIDGGNTTSPFADVAATMANGTDSDGNFSAAPITNGTGGNDNSTFSGQNDLKKNAFRKRASDNNVQLGKSSSSEETDGSGQDPAQPRDLGIINSSENLLDGPALSTTMGVSVVSAAPSDVISKELGSGDGEPLETVTNEVADHQAASKEKIADLRKRMQAWQNAVHNYLQAGRQRRKRQAWDQMFPSAPGATSSNSVYLSGKNIKESATAFVNAAGSAVGDALKPAMELMTQGVGLLTELYSTQLSKPEKSKQRITSENTTVVVDQFREQLNQLQSKLGDLGETLKRVVGTFQEMQSPFLENLMSGGISLGAITSDVNDGNQNTNVLYQNNNTPKKARKNE